MPGIRPNDPDSSVFYHNDDPDDPFVDNPNRQLQDDDYYPCPACGHTGPEDGCRCSCHSERRHH